LQQGTQGENKGKQGKQGENKGKPRANQGQTKEQRYPALSDRSK
jgi:hypothetical protein